MTFNNVQEYLEEEGCQQPGVQLPDMHAALCAYIDRRVEAARLEHVCKRAAGHSDMLSLADLPTHEACCHSLSPTK